MKECFGHKPIGIPTKPKVPRKYNYAYKRKKPIPDYLGYVKGKSTVTALEVCRQFFISEIAAGKVLRDLEKQGIVKSLPRENHDKKVWGVI